MLSYGVMAKLDQRIVRTRKALQDALIALSLERGYENLTIRAVTLHAGVSYATFFRHYKSLEELTTDMFTVATTDMLQLVNEQETLSAETLVVWNFINEHRSLYRLYVALPKAHKARHGVFDAVAEFVRGRYEKRDSSPVPLELSVTHIIESTYLLLLVFLDRGDDYSPEQMAAIQHDLIVRPTEFMAVALREDWLVQHPTYR